MLCPDFCGEIGIKIVNGQSEEFIQVPIIGLFGRLIGVGDLTFDIHPEHDIATLAHGLGYASQEVVIIFGGSMSVHRTVWA